MKELELLLEAEDRVSMAARRLDGLWRICLELTNARGEDEGVWCVFEEELRISRDALREGLVALRATMPRNK